MNAKLRQKAIILRTKHRLSYSAIQKELKVPKSTLSYWLKEHPLNEDEILHLRRESWVRGEVSRERFRNTMRAKREGLDAEIYQKYKRQTASFRKESFFAAGLMLYLGEGDKKSKGRVGLANADPSVIQFFLKWMVDFLGIGAQDMHAELHLYENMDIEEEKSFWENITKLPRKQFYKAQIKKIKEGAFVYQGAQRHGTCSIIFDSVAKKREVTMAIRALLDAYKEMRV